MMRDDQVTHRSEEGCCCLRPRQERLRQEEVTGISDEEPKSPGACLTRYPVSFYPASSSPAALLLHSLKINEYNALSP